MLCILSDGDSSGDCVQPSCFRRHSVLSNCGTWEIIRTSLDMALLGVFKAVFPGWSFPYHGPQEVLLWEKTRRPNPRIFQRANPPASVVLTYWCWLCSPCRFVFKIDEKSTVPEWMISIWIKVPVLDDGQHPIFELVFSTYSVVFHRLRVDVFNQMISITVKDGWVSCTVFAFNIALASHLLCILRLWWCGQQLHPEILLFINTLHQWTRLVPREAPFFE